VTICFTIPFAFGSVRAEDRRPVAQGFLIGIATVPLGAFAGGLVAGLPMGVLLCNLIPLLVLDALLVLGLWRFPQGMISGMVWFGRGLSLLLTVGLVLSVIAKQTGLLETELLLPYDEILLVIGEIVIVLAGAFPFLAVLRRVCGRPLRWLGGRMRLSEAALTGLLTSSVNSIPTFALLRDMDERGKVLNTAFAVSASFLIGDHLAFTLSHAEEMLVPMLVAKAVGGSSALLLAFWLTRRIAVVSKSDDTCD
jgi:ethanolamine transporter